MPSMMMGGAMGFMGDPSQFAMPQPGNIKLFIID